LPLFGTDFILKITTRIKEEMLLNGMKYGVFEPTLLSGRDWANRDKVRRHKGLRESGLERSLF